jgi:hypothetical protein
MVCIEFLDDAAPRSNESEDVPPVIPSPQPRTKSARKPPAPRPMPESVRERESDPPAPARDEGPETPERLDRKSEKTDSDRPEIIEDIPPSYSSYLVIPVDPGQTQPRLRLYVEPTAVASESRVRRDTPNNAARPAPNDLPTPQPLDNLPPPANNIVRLQPAWHTDVPKFFQPAAGIHLFAFVHPYTHQTVAVRVDLPAGQPRLKVSGDQLEFDYGRVEVEVRFRKDGRVSIKTDR